MDISALLELAYVTPTLFDSESDSESNSDMIGFKRSPDQVSYHIQQKAVPTLQVDVYMLEVAVLEKSPEDHSVGTSHISPGRA
jgi:hypothetical protein